MEQLLKQIEQYKEEIEAFAAAGADEVEQFRIKWLGTKGLVKAIMGEMKNVPNDQKKSFGQILNEFKTIAEGKLEVLQNANGGSNTTIKTNIEIPVSQVFIFG